MYIENTLQNSLNSSYLMLQRKNSITSCCISSKPNCINLNTMVAKKIKIIKWIQKITKILHETIHHVCCLYKKFWCGTPIQSSIWLKISTDPSYVYGTTLEMFRFVSNVRENFCEISLIFYHSLHVWYHDITTNPKIFRLRLI